MESCLFRLEKFMLTRIFIALQFRFALDIINSRFIFGGDDVVGCAWVEGEYAVVEPDAVYHKLPHLAPEAASS